MKTAKFDSLTPEQKRITIANDVLEQLRLRRFVATTGTWVRQLGRAAKKKVGEDVEVCDVTRKLKKCNVCALGGMFIAAVERADKLKGRDLQGGTDWDGTRVQLAQKDVFRYMEQFFSKKQLQLIEAAFERGAGACNNTVAEEFCPVGLGPEERMRLIMENIVANNGRFLPGKRPVLIWATPGYEGAA